MRKMSLEKLGRKILAERIKSSPIELAKAFNPNYDVNWHHEIISDVCLNHKRTLLVLPPGSGKTTLASIAIPCWKIGHNPRDESYLICSYNDTYARSILRSNEKIISTFEPYIEAFGRLKPDKPDKWTHQAIIVRDKWDVGTPSIEALGVRSGAIGRHPKHIILDDPIDATIANSKVLLREVKRWFHSELMTRLDPDSTIAVILTRWRFNDLASDLIKDDSWEKILIEAVGKKGPYAQRHMNQSYWPSRWTMSQLREYMKDPYTWNTQYMGDPTAAGEGSPLREEWLTYWTTGEPDPEKRLYKMPPASELSFLQAVDPAIGDQTKDDNFVDLTLAVDRFGNMYVARYVCGHFDPARQVEVIQDEYRAVKPRKIIIESNAAQYYLTRSVMSRILPVEAKKNLADKVGRITITLQPYFKNGSLRISPDQTELISEYRMFPFGDNDDILDALEMAVSDLREQVATDWANVKGFGKF